MLFFFIKKLTLIKTYSTLKKIILKVILTRDSTLTYRTRLPIPMSKPKTIYSCTECTYRSVKWLGMCPECNAWGSLTETISNPTNLVTKKQLSSTHMTSIRDTIPLKYPLLISNISEFDRVMGGGIMPGSLTIITGDPGIGKSTLLMQIGNQLAQRYKVFYFSTEESLAQVHQRAARLNCLDTPMLFADNVSLESIIHTVQQQIPDLVIIDSIQNCYLENQNHMNSVNQLRDITMQLLRLAKQYTIAIIITGHITKEGIIAGPKTLEHMVDGVFYLQAEDQWHTRILRAVKNRFGTLDELGFFEMGNQGLQEVQNINKNFINDITYAPGSILVSTIEGSRPLLLELQALTIETKFGIPQRVISGINHKQVVLIAAILQKYLRISFNTHDIFFKVSGGFTIKGSMCDLGIALALLSSYLQQPVPTNSLALGEISLTGHIKPVNQINILVKESQKFGIDTLLIAKDQKITTNGVVKYFDHVYELVSLFA